MIPTLQLGQFGKVGKRADEAATDPYFANVVLLLHGDGANGNQTIVDSSSYGRTQLANSAQITNSHTYAKFGSGSIFCNGQSISWADSAELVYSGDFTIEGFWRPNSIGTLMRMWGQAASDSTLPSVNLRMETSGKFRAHCYTSANVLFGDITSTSSFSTSAFTYFAYTRSGNNFKLFMNAVQEGGTVTSSNTVRDGTHNFALGGLGSYNFEKCTGYFDEFRVTLGVARDIASIGVPTAAFPDS